MAKHNEEFAAMAEEPAQLLQQEDSDPVRYNIHTNPVLRDKEAHKEFPGDRYRLKGTPPPVLTGNEDGEQFIQEFSDVVEVTQWPPRVALLKLRMSLAEKAKP